MANQSYLVCSDQRLILPSHCQRNFAPKLQTIACGVYCVPVLWLSLFRPSDIREGSLPESGEKVTSPLVHKRFVPRRLALAAEALEKTFPKVSTWQIHADLLGKAIDKATAKRPYLSIEWQEIEQLQSPRIHKQACQWLMKFLAGERVQRPSSRIRDLTDIQWDLSFPDPRTADLTHADEKNLAALLGNDHERPVPWWPPVSSRGSQRKTSAAKGHKQQRAARSSSPATLPVEQLKEQLAEAINARSEARLKKLLPAGQSLADKRFTELLDEAINDQTYGFRSQIPDLLIKRGVIVSPRALCSAATGAGSYAQFRAMVASGMVDVHRASRTVRSKSAAPPMFWIACDDRSGLAVRKAKLLLAAGASVDVRSSAGDWLLYQCIASPSSTRLFVPLASRKHKLAALQFALKYRIAPRAKEKKVDDMIKHLTQFTRALERSGLREAAGREAEIRAKKDSWLGYDLKPYPYRK